ncbi:hypothetical protein Lal_00049282 [Lupinus albus]|nr:hypothetical protein Lal_00049282 [Lupinus albus]
MNAFHRASRGGGRLFSSVSGAIVRPVRAPNRSRRNRPPAPSVPPRKRVHRRDGRHQQFPAASLSGRWLGLHLPRLSPPAPAHQPAGRAGGCGLWLHHDAVEAGRRSPQGGRADPPGRDSRQGIGLVPQRPLRCLQGQPPAPARGSGAAVPADPRCHARVQPALHRGSRAGSGRPYRLLRARGRRARVGRDDRFLRQGPDAACRHRRQRRADRHAGHDEEPADRRARSDREVRRAAGEGGRCPGADGRCSGQCARHSRHRPQDRVEADPGAWRSRSRAGRRAGDEAGQVARKPDRAGADGAPLARAGGAEGRLRPAAAARRFHAGRDPARSAGGVPGEHGFTSLLRKLGVGALAPVSAAPATGQGATGAAERRKARAVRARRDGGGSGGGEPGAWPQRRLLHPAGPWRHRHVRGKAGSGGPDRGARGAQAAAGKRRGAQGRPEHQVRPHDPCPRRRSGRWHRGCTDRRYHGDELLPGCRAQRDRPGRARHGRAFGKASRPRHDEVQGRVRHGQEGDLVFRSAAGGRHALCRGGCGRHLAAAPPVPAAPVGRGRHAHLPARGPAADPGGGDDGAQRHPRRSRTAGRAFGRVRRADRRTRNRDPRQGGRPVHDRQPQAAGRGAVRPAGLQGRQEGQDGAVFDRPVGAGRAGRAGRRSGDAGARMAPAVQAQVDLHRSAASRDQSRDRPRPHQLQPGRRADRPALLERAESPEHSDPYRDRSPDSRGVRGGAGQRPAGGGLFADRTAAGRAHRRRAGAARSVRSGRGHPRAHRDRDVRPCRPRHARARQDDQLRHPLWHQPLGPGRPARHFGRRGAGDDRSLFRALPRHPALYPRDAGERARARLFRDAVRPQDLVPAHQFEESGRAPGQRARGDQRADSGHQRRHYQAGHGAHDARAGGGRAGWRPHAAAGARRTGVRGAGRRCRGGEAGDRAGHGGRCGTRCKTFGSAGRRDRHRRQLGGGALIAGRRMDAMGGFPANDWGDGDEGGGQEVWEAGLLLDATRAVAAAEEAARQAEQRFREALDALPQGIVVLDAEGRYIHWNEEYARIYHRARREEEWLADRLDRLEHAADRHEQWLSDGRCIMIEERKTSDGGTIGLRVDITEMKQREESFRLLFESNPVPLLVYDPAEDTIVSANAAAADHFGYDLAELAGLPAERLFAAEEWSEAQRLLATTGSQKDRFWRQLRKDGQELESVLFTRQSMLDGRLATIASVFDVTERRKVEARIAHMARHDELTGLANRAHCRERLRDLLTGGAPERPVGDRRADRSRPLQADQRHVRPSRRRRSAGGGGAAHGQPGARRWPAVPDRRRRIRGDLRKAVAHDGRLRRQGDHHRDEGGVQRQWLFAAHRRHDRHGIGTRRYRQSRNAAALRRSGALCRQGRPTRHDAPLRARHGRRRAGKEPAGGRFPQGDPAGRTGGPLSAADRSRDRRGRMLRGAGALAPPRARHGDARRLHRPGRGNRPDRRGRPVRAAECLPRGDVVAGARQAGGQCLAHPVPIAQPAGHRGAGAVVGGHGPAAAGAGNHRGRPDGKGPAGFRHDRIHPRAGRGHIDGRFRHRLQLAQLSAELPLHQDQDRQVLRARLASGAQFAGGGARDHRPGPQPGPDRHRRRHRGGNGAGLPARRRMRAGAGLPDRPGAARKRTGRDARDREGRGLIRRP